MEATNRKRGTAPIILQHEGQSHSLSEWARITGIPCPTITQRYHKGLTPSEILCPQSRRRKWQHLFGTPTYRAWANIKVWCNNANHPTFQRIGAVGIGLCPKWTTFQGFLDDMGESPKGYFLTRLDRTKDYCKENCRWTEKRPKRGVRALKLIVGNETHTRQEWAALAGINRDTLRSRLRRGLSPAEAVSPEHFKANNHSDFRNDAEFISIAEIAAAWRVTRQRADQILRKHGAVRHQRRHFVGYCRTEVSAIRPLAQD